MRYSIQNGSNAVVQIHLDEGEEIRAETGAMITRDDHINFETTTGDSGLGGTMKKFLSDERSVVNRLGVKTRGFPSR